MIALLVLAWMDQSPELSKPFTCSSLEATLSEFSQELSKASGKNFTVEKNVAGLAITAFLKNVSIKSTMDAVASTFRLKWKHEGDKWILYQPEELASRMTQHIRNERKLAEAEFRKRLAKITADSVPNDPPLDAEELLLRQVLRSTREDAFKALTSGHPLIATDLEGTGFPQIDFRLAGIKSFGPHWFLCGLTDDGEVKYVTYEKSGGTLVGAQLTPGWGPGIVPEYKSKTELLEETEKWKPESGLQLSVDKVLQPKQLTSPYHDRILTLGLVLREVHNQTGIPIVAWTSRLALPDTPKLNTRVSEFFGTLHSDMGQDLNQLNRVVCIRPSRLWDWIGSEPSLSALRTLDEPEKITLPEFMHFVDQVTYPQLRKFCSGRIATKNRVLFPIEDTAFWKFFATVKPEDRSLFAKKNPLSFQIVPQTGRTWFVRWLNQELLSSAQFEDYYRLVLGIPPFHEPADLSILRDENTKEVIHLNGSPDLPRGADLAQTSLNLKIFLIHPGGRMLLPPVKLPWSSDFKLGGIGG